MADKPVIKELDPKGAYWLDCPGCNAPHIVYVNKTNYPDYPSWSFNGDLAKPTFSPSLLVTWPNKKRMNAGGRCHSFIRDGNIQFLPDCTHVLAGQTVPLVLEEN